VATREHHHDTCATDFAGPWPEATVPNNNGTRFHNSGHFPRDPAFQANYDDCVIGSLLLAARRVAWIAINFRTLGLRSN
jgi:hypothetical protein